MNSRILLSGRLAAATMLMVLAAPDVSGQVKTFDVKGTLDGHGIGVVQPPTLQASASGEARASHIGRFTYALQAAVNLVNNTSTGIFLLVFNNGDVIHGTFTGVGGTPGPNNIVENLIINGGTGRFEGATGSFKLNRTVDQSTLPAYEWHSGILTGTIVIQK